MIVKVVLNSIFAAILYVFWESGLVAGALSHDPFFILPTILIVFLAGMVACFIGKPVVAEWCGESLAYLALLGAAFGLLSTFTGLSVTSIGNIASLGSTIAVLIQGMGSALYATVAGLFFNRWLTVNIMVDDEEI